MDVDMLQREKVAGRGKIVCKGEHSGFRVWMNAEQSTSTAEGYVIRGKNNPHNTLKVILRGNGWVPDNTNGSGIIKKSHDSLSNFDILTEESQVYFPDEYIISVNGICT